MLGLGNHKSSERELVAKEEIGESKNIPFSHHYDKNTICNKDGTMFQIIALNGIAFETIDDNDLVSEKKNRNQLFTSSTDELTGIYTYTIRREEKTIPEGEFEPGTFPHELNAAYMDMQGKRKAFVNEHYLVVARKPYAGAQESLMNLAQLFYKPHKKKLVQEYADRREILGRKTLEILKRFENYKPRLLEVKEVDGQTLSEPLAFLNQLINHNQRKQMLPKMDLSRYLPSSRHIFGHETIEVRYPDKTRFAAMISIKEYGTPTDAGMLDHLLEQPIEMTISQSFMVIEHNRAIKMLEDAQRMLIQAEDPSTSQIAEMEEAMDDLASRRMSLGEHNFSIFVIADSEKELIEDVATIYSELGSLGGLNAVREDLNLENAFWAMLPGNGSKIVRGTPITSKNFSGFASFHNQPSGKRDNNHWGPCVSVVSTPQGTPYFINFHDHDLGMTNLIGPSGYGKTLLLCFLLAQSMKFMPRIIYLDYERGADIFIRAIKGDYKIVSPEHKTGWNPLQLPDTHENRTFLFDWFSMLLTSNNEVLDAKEKETIHQAIIGNYKLPQKDRQLEHVAPFMGMGQADSLYGRLQQWYGNGHRAYLFDNPVDELNIDKGVIGFDMTHLNKDDIGRNPAFLYLYHRIEQSLDGYPTMIPIDEAWSYFDIPYFASRLKEKLKVIRRKNGMFIFGTNDVSDAANSPISSTLITQSATNIFFGNDRADVDEYKKFGLSDKEISIIKNTTRNERYFILKQSHESVVLKLDMTGLENYIPILSSNEKNAQKLNDIIHQVGDDPNQWIPALINNKEGSTSCAA